jgi:hypothetical protein
MHFRYILKVAVFICGLVLILSLLERKYESVSIDEEAVHKLKTGWYNFNSNADIYIMGSSRALGGFPFSEIEGLKVFNYGRSGSNPKYHYQLYADFIKPNFKKKPKYIIYEIDWFSFDERSLQNTIEIDFSYMPKEIFLKHIINNISELDKSVINRFYVLKANKKDFSHIKQLFPTKTKSLDKENKPSNKINCDPELGDTGKIVDDQLFYFLKLVTEIRKDGIDLILVQVPEHRPLRNSKQIDYNNAFITYLADYNNIKFFNYNKVPNYINYNKNYFIDWTHLNETGRKEFSKYIINDLSRYVSSNN